MCSERIVSEWQFAILCSCSTNITLSVEAGFLRLLMYLHDIQFFALLLPNFPFMHSYILFKFYLTNLFYFI